MFDWSKVEGIEIPRCTVEEFLRKVFRLRRKLTFNGSMLLERPIEVPCEEVYGTDAKIMVGTAGLHERSTFAEIMAKNRTRHVTLLEGLCWVAKNRKKILSKNLGPILLPGVKYGDPRYPMIPSAIVWEKQGVVGVGLESYFVFSPENSSFTNPKPKILVRLLD